jgi:hypothetical protein
MDMRNISVNAHRDRRDQKMTTVTVTPTTDDDAGSVYV